MEKELEINSKKYRVKEITYLQAIEVEEIRQKSGLGEASKHMIKCAVGLLEEDIVKLSVKEGLELQRAINEVNELNFRSPAEEEGQK